MKKSLFKSFVVLLSSTLMLMIPLTGLADDYLYADVNRDGEVTIADVNAVIAAILGDYNPPSGSTYKTFEVKGVSFKMVKVDGGRFWMGGAEDDPDVFSDERPQRVVQLSDYYIGETEVTQELWEAVMGYQPSGFSGLQKPVECVSWDDCKEFITRLNAITGQQFRLPTEAEWEFAARGGNKSNGYIYSGSNVLNEVAVWTGNYSTPSTQSVGQMRPNELGIYDMSGNVFEWCNDWYGTYPSPSIFVSTGIIELQDIPAGATQTSATFSVSGNQLSNDVYITVEGTGFAVSPQFIGVKEANEGSRQITVTYTGSQLAAAEGKIIISSKHAVDKDVELRYRCPSLSVMVTSNPIVISEIASPSRVFGVIGHYLTQDVQLEIEGEGFTLEPNAPITPDVNGEVATDVRVSYTKPMSIHPAYGKIKVSSMGIVEYIDVIAQVTPTIEIEPIGPIMIEDSISKATFKVIGHNLLDTVKLSVDNIEKFSLSPNHIVPNNIGGVNEVIIVTYSDTLGSDSEKGVITISSTGIEKTVEVIAQLKSDSTTSQISCRLAPALANNVGSDYEGYVDVDPRGQSYGSYRIMRGGAWNTESKFCRVSYRYGRETTFKHSSLGLRLAM